MTSAATDPVRDAPLLAVRGVTKSFGGARALRGVDFTLCRGEVHALLGEMTGRRAAELLIERIQDPQKPPVAARLPSKLIIRRFCGWGG
jgi:ABC-type phosphonate transport system ATPase subunit